MLAFWSQSSIAAHFAFCFTSCVVMLAFLVTFNSCPFTFCFIVVLRVASGPRMKLAGRKSALNPLVVYSTDRSKAVVPAVLVLFFVALWFILQGDLFYVLPCVILFLCFSVLLALRLPRLGKSSICACLDLSVSSSSWCLGRATVCDCGPWTFLLPFFLRRYGQSVQNNLSKIKRQAKNVFPSDVDRTVEAKFDLSLKSTNEFVKIHMWFCKFVLSVHS